jgi:hypothetical protein
MIVAVLAWAGSRTGGDEGPWLLHQLEPLEPPCAPSGECRPACATGLHCATDVRGLGWLFGRRHPAGLRVTVDALLGGGFVAIDVETTGLDIASARVVEVAAIPFRLYRGTRAPVSAERGGPCCR